MPDQPASAADPNTLLTRAREAVWRAIDESPLLADELSETGRAFRRLMRFDDDLPERDAAPSGISDFPCLSIVPTTIDPAWFTAEMMNFHLVLACVLWTDGWQLPQPEQLAVRIWRAIHKQGEDGPTSTVSYIQRAIGYHPKLVRPIEFAFVRVGEQQQTKATRVTLRIGLRCQQDPFA